MTMGWPTKVHADSFRSEHVHTKWGQMCDMMSKIKNALIEYICALGFSVQMEASMPGVSRILNDNISKYSEKMTHCQVCHLDTIFTQKMALFQWKQVLLPNIDMIPAPPPVTILTAIIMLSPNVDNVCKTPFGTYVKSLDISNFLKVLFFQYPLEKSEWNSYIFCIQLNTFHTFCQIYSYPSNKCGKSFQLCHVHHKLHHVCHS